jgi:hypothetical protein
VTEETKEGKDNNDLDGFLGPFIFRQAILGFIDDRYGIHNNLFVAITVDRVNLETKGDVDRLS